MQYRKCENNEQITVSRLYIFCIWRKRKGEIDQRKKNRKCNGDVNPAFLSCAMLCVYTFFISKMKRIYISKKRISLNYTESIIKIMVLFSLDVLSYTFRTLKWNSVTWRCSRVQVGRHKMYIFYLISKVSTESMKDNRSLPIAFSSSVAFHYLYLDHKDNVEIMGEVIV